MKDIFISSSALDDIIFYCIKNYEPNEVINKIDELIAYSGLNRNSIVIVPLHSFGFKYLGARHLLNGNSVFSYEYKNFTIYPQTNSYDKTVDIIKSYLNKVKLPNRSKIDYELFEHFYKSRELKWLISNPFMIIHFKFSQKEKFDNMQFILEKIELITNKLYFIYSLADSDNDLGSLFSTKNTNNWETLDIKHFLTISTERGNAQLNCLPVHFMIYGFSI